MSLLSMAFYVTQLNTLLESVVDLVPHSGTIQIGFGGKLLEFVNALAGTPYFDIDTKKISDTLVSFTTAETDPASFAQKFSMHLKLKEPISLRP